MVKALRCPNVFFGLRPLRPPTVEDIGGSSQSDISLVERASERMHTIERDESEETKTQNIFTFFSRFTFKNPNLRSWNERRTHNALFHFDSS
jgi:hypothetical protein